MSDDDEALRWAGDEPPQPVEERRGATRLETTPGQSSLQLIAYGIVAGFYGIATVGWITSVLRSSTTLSNLPAEILYQLGEFLAIALPALWFVAVLWLERRPPRRLLWLLIGIPLVLPWPWVLGQ